MSEQTAKVLEGLAESMPRLANAQAEAARLAQAGDTGAAIARLQDCLEAWSHIREGIICGLTVVGDIAEISVDEKSIDEHATGLAEVLGRLHEALENQDMVGAADVLEYELNPITKTWETIIRALVEAIGRPEATAEPRDG